VNLNPEPFCLCGLNKDLTASKNMRLELRNTENHKWV
jgi:hypothetical protein